MQGGGGTEPAARKCSRDIRRSDTISDTIRVYELSHWFVNS